MPFFLYPEFRAKFGASVPNYKGMFLRGYGSQSHTKNNGSNIGNTATNHASGNLGQVQGDAARRIRGGFYSLAIPANSSYPYSFNPFLYNYSPVKDTSNSEANKLWGQGIINMDSNTITPTDIENRPANIAVRWIIRIR